MSLWSGFENILPRGRLRWGGRAGSAVAVCLALGTAAAAPQAKPHPRLVDAASAKCVTCHAALFQDKPRVHPPAAADCAACHEVRVEAGGTTVTPVADGPALCLSCHAALASAASGKLKSPHPPVTDSCTMCHDPHASANERLLVSPVRELCSTCHDVPGINGKHDGQLTAATNCVACHAPHGSDSAHLFKGSHLHPPFSEKSCDACHRTPSSDRVRLLARGEQLCAACHGDIADPKPGASFHPALRADRAARGCLSCHDPHLSANAKLLVQTGPALCARCHAGIVKAAGQKGGHPPAADDCLNCHSPHQGKKRKLLAEVPPALCLTCHDAGSAGAAVPPTPAPAAPSALPATRILAVEQDGDQGGLGFTVRSDGRLTYKDFTLARPDRLVVDFENVECPRAGRTLEVRRGPVRRVRLAPLSPGASKTARLVVDLASPTPHRVVATPEGVRVVFGEAAAPAAARPVSAPAPRSLSQAHLGADVAKLDCTQCHSPHGEGNPKSLARTVHPPVLEDCGICHLGSSKKLLEDGESALCLNCHGEIGDLAKRAKAPHAALEVARCVECHNPHASPQERLVKSPGGGPCLTCHDEKGASPGEKEHGAITLLGCRACHEPHGGENPKLLRRTGNALCLGCHDAREHKAGPEKDVVTLLDRFRVTPQAARAIASLRITPDGQRDHPLPNHPVAGTIPVERTGRVQTTFSGELTCLTCHDPHKARFKLLQWKAATAFDACLKCHPK